MIQPVFLVSFKREKDAQLLAAYLNSQNIQASVAGVSGEHPYGLKLQDPEQLEAAKVIAQDYIKNAQDTKYQKAAWEHGGTIQQRPEVNLGAFFKFQSVKHTPFTLVIFIACCTVYGISLFGGFSLVRELLFFIDLGTMAETSQWWRLITPAFIHFSEVHIIFNLLWWWTLGGQLEKRFGTSGLLTLFLLASLTSNLAQYWTSGTNFGGLSGVVYALVGFVWWCGWLRPQWGIALPKPVVGFLLVWLLIGYADILWINMANTAHTVGLVSGCFAAWVVTRYSPVKT